MKNSKKPYEKTKKEILALPRRGSSVRATKKKVLQGEQDPSFCRRPSVQVPPVPQDRQSGKLSSKKNTNYVPPVTVCNTSVGTTTSVPQEDLNLIFKTYEEGFNKKLDEPKKIEFAMLLDEAKTSTQEVLERLETLRRDDYLRLSTTSIVRVFYINAALESTQHERRQNKPSNGFRYVPQVEAETPEYLLTDLVAKEDAEVERLKREEEEEEQPQKEPGQEKQNPILPMSLNDLFPGDSSSKLKNKRFLP